jgi:hypothetical protein
MQFKVIIAVVLRLKPINAMCGQNLEFLIVKEVVHPVSV